MKLSLNLNSKKTEIMVISKKQNIPQINTNIEGNILKQVHRFNYLGTIITSDGRCSTDIRNRISQAKVAFQKMKGILCNKSLSIEVRKRTRQCYLEPIMTYGCKSWNINKSAQKTIEAGEMWFYRRMLRIPWTDRNTNENVLKEANTQRTIITRVRTRQSRLFGHIM